MPEIKEKMRSIVNAGKHCAIERFSVIMLVVLIACIALVFWIVSANIKQSQDMWANQAIYKGSFVSSETQTQGSVVAVNTNEDRSKALILLKMNDMSRLTSNVGNYGVGVTGGYMDNDYVHAIDLNIHGGVYMLGNTGYIAILLDSDRPFPEDIYHITLRVGRTSSLLDDYVFDDMNIKINLAAQGIRHVQALDSDTLDLGAYLSEAWLNSQDVAARSTLRDDLVEMRECLMLAEEYTDKLAEYDVDVDAMIPAYVRGDVVNVSEDGALSLTTSTFADNNIEIDYVGGNVVQGYFAALGSDQSLQSYINSVGDRAKYDSSLGSSEWRYKNGVAIEETDDVTMLKVIDNLVSTWEDYMKLKGEFQVTDRLAFLENEALYNSLTENVTEHVGDNVVWTW